MLFSILIFSVVLTPQSFGYGGGGGGGKEPDPSICGDRLCSEIPGGRDAWENKETIPFTIKNQPSMTSPSLKTQIKNGISPDFLTCTDGFELIFKLRDNSPVCVKPKTAEKLIERGWALAKSLIDSFEECVAAGNPVMESYPRQCRTSDGKHFVEEIIQPENIVIPKEKQELYQYALELVNEDRKKHGVLPVKLGTNPSAQNHADDQLKNSYFSHWNTQGVKPYVTYTEFGGTASVGENIAFSQSICPTSNCLPNTWDPSEQIKSHQYSMMYDDADSDWGHRDNIIDPYHTLVNFGVSWNENNFYFAQHFETKIIQWNNLEIVNDRTLNLNGAIPSNYKMSNILIFEDDSIKQVSGSSLNNEFPYNAGYYDQGRFVGMLVEPPQTGYYYEECDIGKLTTNGTDGIQCVDYVIYDEIGGQINQVNISADVSQWLSQNGLHTIYVTLEDTTTGELVEAASITLEYLEDDVFYP